MEVFGGGSGGSKYVPWWKIEEIKRNMKKVPIIQAKNDAKHNKQVEEAEKKFLEEQKKLREEEKIQKEKEEAKKNYKKQKKYIKWLFTKIKKLLDFFKQNDN